jgi:hypothetical protein
VSSHLPVLFPWLYEIYCLYRNQFCQPAATGTLGQQDLFHFQRVNEAIVMLSLVDSEMTKAAGVM